MTIIFYCFRYTYRIKSDSLLFYIVCSKYCTQRSSNNSVTYPIISWLRLRCIFAKRIDLVFLYCEKRSQYVVGVYYCRSLLLVGYCTSCYNGHKAYKLQSSVFILLGESSRSSDNSVYLAAKYCKIWCSWHGDLIKTLHNTTIILSVSVCVCKWISSKQFDAASNAMIWLLKNNLLLIISPTLLFLIFCRSLMIFIAKLFSLRLFFYVYVKSTSLEKTKGSAP